MLLEGSCHCGAVRFSVESAMPHPYLLCYCSICRKTDGGGGYAINLGADSSTLEVEGGENIGVYNALMRDGDDSGDAEASPGRRSFCSLCATALWVYDPRWPELVHPFASAVDTPLPEPPETVRMMLADRTSWAEMPEGEAARGERHFQGFPDESLEEWHRRHGLYDT
jgi:hypothetical protein